MTRDQQIRSVEELVVLMREFEDDDYELALLAARLRQRLDALESTLIVVSI